MPTPPPLKKFYAPLIRPVKMNVDTGIISDFEPDTNEDPSPEALCLAITKQILDTPPVVTGHFKAEKVWNSVWNDYADFQLLNDELIPGKCYFDTEDGAKICNQRCQLSVIGLATDTFAQAVGVRDDQAQLPIAVAGWALAFVDKQYPCGTPLTNNENGELTEMTLEEKRNYPERIVGIYKRLEHDKEFGTSSKKIQVNGRHWVKVK